MHRLEEERSLLREWRIALSSPRLSLSPRRYVYPRYMYNVGRLLDTEDIQEKVFQAILKFRVVVLACNLVDAPDVAETLISVNIHVFYL